MQAERNSHGTFKPIDVREVFASKSPGLSRLIPGFVYRYITRIMHIDYINDLLSRQGHLEGISFVEQVIKEFNVKEHVYGLENIPASGRFIFASNHPLGGFDGMLLMKTVYKKLGKVKFLTNDILLNIPQFRSVFVPVNKHGGHSREAALLLDEAYRSDDQILIFPSGLASRKTGGKIEDLEWKKHFISKAIRYKRDIIPVFVAGRNSDRFYRLAKIRKFLKIKWNLEMFFLPDETMRHRNTDVHLYFGKPVSYKNLDKSKTHSEWAAWLKEQTYSLPGIFKVTNY